jgi:type I restriction enzyme S subunit
LASPPTGATNRSGNNNPNPPQKQTTMPQNQLSNIATAEGSSEANQISHISRPGFKQTKIGWLPVEWEVVRLKDIATIGTGSTPSRDKPEYWDNGTIPWLPTGKANDYEIHNADQFVTPLALKETSIKILPRNTILIGMIGQGKTRGMSAIMRLEATVNQNFAYIITRDRVVPDYLFSKITFDYLKIRGGGRGGGQESLNGQIIKSIKIALPPLKEQHRIATCLSTWDHAITTTRNLLEQLETRKKGLMQRLLTGEVRLPGFEGEWEQVKVGEFLRESRLPGSNGLDAEKLTVKLWGRGVRRKIDKQPGSVNTNYFKRKSGQLIYSKLDFLNCAFGIVPDNLDGLESTLDLPTFDFNDQVEPKFILERIK